MHCRAAVLVRRDPETGDRLLARALGDEIDAALRGHEAVVEGECALEHFDPLLVLQGDVDQVDDREAAVEPIVAPVLDHDTANGDIVISRTVQLGAGDAGRPRCSFAAAPRCRSSGSFRQTRRH